MKVMSDVSMATGSCMFCVVMDTVDGGFTDSISDMLADVLHGTSLMVRIIKMKTNIFMFTVQCVPCVHMSTFFILLTWSWLFDAQSSSVDNKYEKDDGNCNVFQPNRYSLIR